MSTWKQCPIGPKYVILPIDFPLKIYFIYFKEIFLLLIPQMITVTETVLDQGLGTRASSRSSVWVQGPKNLGCLPLLFRLLTWSWIKRGASRTWPSKGNSLVCYITTPVPRIGFSCLCLMGCKTQLQKRCLKSGLSGKLQLQFKYN